MTIEQFNTLKPLEYGRPVPVFSSVIAGKTPTITKEDITLLNSVSRPLFNTVYSTCPSCVIKRRLYLKRMAEEWMKFKNTNNL